MFKENKITKDISRAKKFFEDIVSYTVGPYGLNEMIKKELNDIKITDVRDYDDYTDGHIPYAMHIPVDKIIENKELFDKEKLNVIYTYSDSCPRAYKTALALLEHNFVCVTLRGGFKEWKKFGFEIIKND